MYVCSCDHFAFKLIGNFVEVVKLMSMYVNLYNFHYNFMFIYVKRTNTLMHTHTHAQINFPSCAYSERRRNIKDFAA